jgi:hypothetical protein
MRHILRKEIIAEIVMKCLDFFFETMNVHT